MTILSDAPTDLASVRLIEGFQNKWEAEQMVETYSAMLRRKGETERFGVFLRQMPGRDGGYGVYVRDRAVVKKKR